MSSFYKMQITYKMQSIYILQDVELLQYVELLQEVELLKYLELLAFYNLQDVKRLKQGKTSNFEFLCSKISSTKKIKICFVTPLLCLQITVPCHILGSNWLQCSAAVSIVKNILCLSSIPFSRLVLVLPKLFIMITVNPSLLSECDVIFDLLSTAENNDLILGSLKIVAFT